MKFIFPQNYSFNPKVFGIIEYSAAILDLIWGSLVFLITKLFIHTLSIKICIFIILFLPIFIFSIVGVQGENLIYFINYMFKYFIKQKIYFYEKNTNYKE